MQEKLTQGFSRLLAVCAAAALVWLSLRYLLRWAAPFLAAWALAALLEPAVAFLVRHRWRRGAAAGLCSLAAFALILWGLGALVWKGVGAAAELGRELPAVAEALGLRLRELEALVRQHIRDAPEPSALFLEKALEGLDATLSEIPAQISLRAVALVTRSAQASPDTLLSLVTTALGTGLISASYPHLQAFLLAQLPDRLRLRLEGLGGDLKSGFGGVLRAQLLLMLLTFFELLPAFLLLHVRGAFVLAAVTALIDALPVFGTGVVLVPWALSCFLLGAARRGLALLFVWGMSCLVRSFAQAKLLGDQIGLDPLASLVGVYVGWRCCGILGMLLFPLLLVLLIRLNERGVLRLWRETDE